MGLSFLPGAFGELLGRNTDCCSLPGSVPALQPLRGTGQLRFGEGVLRGGWLLIFLPLISPTPIYSPAPQKLELPLAPRLFILSSGSATPVHLASTRLALVT